MTMDSNMDKTEGSGTSYSQPLLVFSSLMPMKSWVMEVPGQPVAKERPRRGKGGTWYTPRPTRIAEEKIAWLARASTWDFADAEICLLTHFFSSSRRFDLDNAHKLVADALQKGGLFDNDRQIVAGMYAWYPSDNPRTLIGVCEWNDKAGDVFKLLS